MAWNTLGRGGAIPSFTVRHPYRVYHRRPPRAGRVAVIPANGFLAALLDSGVRLMRRARPPAVASMRAIRTILFVIAERSVSAPAPSSIGC
ncbi:MAG TPA: hypothetical protein DEP05_03945 [Betaproteobacteria bacterium]|nr:hypothetical protein [Betaproteobacteria bacterium]